MSNDDDTAVKGCLTSVEEDRDDPDLTPADAETGYMHEGADEDEYNDEEPLLVPVERWEMQRCSCDRSINPREITVQGEVHPRCFECAKPRYPLPSPPSVNSGTFQSTVAPVF